MRMFADDTILFLKAEESKMKRAWDEIEGY